MIADEYSHIPPTISIVVTREASQYNVSTSYIE